MEDKYRHYKVILEKKQEQNRFKQLKFMLQDQDKNNSYNFQSSDFLNISSHPYVKKNTIKYILEFGIGSQHCRSNLDHIKLQRQIENKLRLFTGFEESFFVQSDQNIHFHLLQTLTHTKSILFVDRGCHRNIVKGAMESNGKVVWYEHNNTQQLKEILKQHDSYVGYTKIILSESVFSNYGDLCYLNTLISLSDEFRAILYIDDSSSFSVMGENGMGFTSCKKGIDLVVSSPLKSFTSFGHYILCSAPLKETLFELSTDIPAMHLLPPANLGAIDAILDIIPDMDAERQKLQKNAIYLRRMLKEREFTIGTCSSHIIPIFFDNKEEAKLLYDYLLEHHIFCLMICVDGNQPVIKVIVQSSHTKEDLDYLIHYLSSWKLPLAYKTI
ncbi:MAG: pyridoxal phosphate-dependent aminotransferase family protein [Chlamydiales bacterium]|nr:pyridoxal phosphate-dependent aminotransferase family protein [Chlamydiales bacterium]